MRKVIIAFMVMGLLFLPIGCANPGSDGDFKTVDIALVGSMSVPALWTELVEFGDEGVESYEWIDEGSDFDQFIGLVYIPPSVFRDAYAMLFDIALALKEYGSEGNEFGVVSLDGVDVDYFKCEHRDENLGKVASVYVICFHTYNGGTVSVMIQSSPDGIGALEELVIGSFELARR